MVALAYVLIDCPVGKELEVYKEIENLKKPSIDPKLETRVDEVHMLWGNYGLIARVVSPDFNQLGVYVIDKIRSAHDVTGIKVLTAITFSHK